MRLSNSSAAKRNQCFVMQHMAYYITGYTDYNYGKQKFSFFLSLTFLLKQICKKADLCYIIIKSMIVQNESEKSEYRK